MFEQAISTGIPLTELSVALGDPLPCHRRVTARASALGECEAFLFSRQKPRLSWLRARRARPECPRLVAVGRARALDYGRWSFHSARGSNRSNFRAAHRGRTVLRARP